MRSPIISALILVTSAAAGCGGSVTGSGGVSVDCDAMCKKSTECGYTQTLTECKESCAAANQIGNGAYLGAIQGCWAKACDQVEKCIEGAILSCDGDPESLFDAYCDKINSCDSSISVDFCKSQFTTGELAEVTQYLRCINDDTLSAVSSCADQASCESFDTDTQKCFESAIDLTSDSSSSTSSGP